MNDAARVRELDGEADVDEPREQLAARPLRGSGALREHVVRASCRPAASSRSTAALLVDAEIVDRDDRRVVEPALDARFAEEPHRPRVGSRMSGRISLTATSRSIADVVREPDLAHAAAPEQVAHRVAIAIRRRRDGVCTAVMRDARRGRLRLQIVVGHPRRGYRIRPLRMPGSCSRRSGEAAPASRAAGELRRAESTSDLPCEQHEPFGAAAESSIATTSRTMRAS